MKRTLALLLALLLMLPSCASENPEDDVVETDPSDVFETVAEEETDLRRNGISHGLPDETYDGEDFRVLYRDAASYTMSDAFVEGLTGEVINDAVHNRNIYMEDTYDFKFVPIPHEAPTDTLTAEFFAGSDSYDFATDSMSSLFKYALKNYFNDWNDMKYFDPEDPWWDANCAADLSIANKIYVMAGDISMQPSDRARFVYYNKGILADYQLPNPYDYVREGKWTIDAMTDMVAAVSTDLDGDGIFTADDRIGMLTEGADYFISGCGVFYTEKDENDMPFVNCINERTIAALDAVRNMLEMENCTLTYDEAADGRDISGYPHIYNFIRYEYYATGHFLFVQNGTNVASQFIDMEPGYGVLPNPKLDEEQEKYYHLSDPFSCGWVIPGTNSKMGMTDIILTAWAYNSDELIDAYYETTLKHKRFNAPDDSEMLDIIRDSVRYEIALFCNLGITNIISSAYKDGNLMSNYAKREKALKKQINITFADFIG